MHYNQKRKNEENMDRKPDEHELYDELKEELDDPKTKDSKKPDFNQAEQKARKVARLLN